MINFHLNIYYHHKYQPLEVVAVAAEQVSRAKLSDTAAATASAPDPYITAAKTTFIKTTAISEARSEKIRNRKSTSVIAFPISNTNFGENVKK